MSLQLAYSHPVGVMAKTLGLSSDDPVCFSGRGLDLEVSMSEFCEFLAHNLLSELEGALTFPSWSVSWSASGIVLGKPCNVVHIAKEDWPPLVEYVFINSNLRDGDPRRRLLSLLPVCPHNRLADFLRTWKTVPGWSLGENPTQRLHFEGSLP